MPPMLGIAILAALVLITPVDIETQVKPRARNLGIPFDGTAGTLNAIT